MLQPWLIIICLVILILIYFLITIVFCFWSVYLLDAIKRKWKINRNALRCIQSGDNDSVQQIIVYDSKTEFVKYVFLFFMNLVEWLALVPGTTFFLLNYTKLIQENSPNYQSSVNPEAFNNSTENSELYLNINSSLYYPPIGNFFFLLGQSLVASMCMYLSKRFAQKSWIKSDKIPILIVTFTLYGILLQILSLFCTINLIASWFDRLCLTVAFIILLKEFRKLRMVVNWSIVDLKVSHNYSLLKRQIKMKKIFTKTFIVICVGVIFLLTSQFLYTIKLTMIIVLRDENNSSYISICECSHISHPEIISIFKVLNWLNLISGLIGGLIIVCQFIGYGLSTMCVILWRLIRGKTGYKTHFNNELFVSLIQE